jgi:hypothetical protein
MTLKPSTEERIVILFEYVDVVSSSNHPKTGISRIIGERQTNNTFPFIRSTSYLALVDEITIRKLTYLDEELK